MPRISKFDQNMTPPKKGKKNICHRYVRLNRAGYGR